jgi:hypothetical protein
MREREGSGHHTDTTHLSYHLPCILFSLLFALASRTFSLASFLSRCFADQRTFGRPSLAPLPFVSALFALTCAIEETDSADLVPESSHHPCLPLQPVHLRSRRWEQQEKRATNTQQPLPASAMRIQACWETRKRRGIEPRPPDQLARTILLRRCSSSRRCSI